MPDLFVITHSEVVVEATVPVPDWRLSGAGRHRAEQFARSGMLSNLGRIWSSAEAKARETAAILAGPKALTVSIDVGLGENDRSATGYLPPATFETATDAFFAHPTQSFRGWERALDAQNRICDTVQNIVSRHDSGDLAIVTHGAVGTLLYCRWQAFSIDRAHDQPGQGHYWRADLATRRVLHGWRAIA